MDEVHANGFTITIDVAFFASVYRTSAATLSSAGGVFTVSDGVVVTGDVIAGTTTCMTFNAGTSAVYVLNGDIRGSATTGTARGAVLTTGSLTVNGSSTGGSVGSSIFGTSSAGIEVSNVVDAAYLLLTGNAVAGNGNKCVGVSGGQIASTMVLGYAEGNAGTDRNGLRTGTVRELRSYNYNCLVTEMIRLTSPSLITDISLCFAKAGFPVQINYFDETGTDILCNPLYAQGQADPTDVRSGTLYANGALTGTCNVPPAASVALNVPVNNTVGSLATAAVVAADLLNEMNNSNLTIAQGLRDGMGASAAAIAAVGSINVIP
jgi:hypothetical protein